MAFVQSRSINPGASPGVITLAFTNPVVAGDLLVVATASTVSGPGPAVPTDTLGNTYVLLPGSTTGFESPGINVFAATSIDSGPCTVSANVSLSIAAVMAIAEYSNSTDTVDQSNFSVTFGSTTNPTGAVTTTQAPELLFASFMDNNTAFRNAAPVTIDSSFTIRETIFGGDVGSGNCVTLSIADLVDAVIGTYNPTFSAGGAVIGDELDASINTFKPAVKPPAPPAPPNKTLLALSPRSLPWPNRPIPTPPQKDYKSVM